MSKTKLYKGTDRELVEWFINEVKSIYKPAGISHNHTMENLTLHEYYFRTKLYNVKLNKEQLTQILEQFMWCFASPGKNQSGGAILSVSEALTQASLKAIHGGKGGAKSENVIRTAGIDRFQELLSGNSPKFSVITIKLYNDGFDSCLAYANEQESFYYNNIFSEMSLVIFNKILPEVEELHPTLNLDKILINYWFIKSIWNLDIISNFNVHVCDVIDGLMSKYDEIVFITGTIVNSKQFLAYIYFKPEINHDRIIVIMEEWKQQRTSTIIRGGYLKNCSITENKNKPGKFIIEANELNDTVLALENLIYDPRVDPYGSKTTNTSITYNMFGVNEAAVRLHEEILFASTNLSETKNVLPRHYKLLADSILSSGEFKYAVRGSMKVDEAIDPIKLVSFETPRDMLHASLLRKNNTKLYDPLSSMVFGELPDFGSGVSKVTLYHNR